MSEWQPARIAPASNVRFHTGMMSRHDLWEADEGIIIRVRPAPSQIPLRTCPMGAVFEIHPEDVVKLGAGPHHGDLLLCEHQIETD